MDTSILDQTSRLVEGIEEKIGKTKVVNVGKKGKIIEI